jgi:hypothetical protein
MTYAPLTTEPSKAATSPGSSVFAASRACLQRKPVGNTPAPAYAPSIVHEALRTDGQPLDPSLRDPFSSHFHHDFTRIRVHTNQRAEQSAAAVQARAYTVGQDIVFGRGEYQPQTHSGRQLLAHELTHTIQQQHVATPSISKLPIDSPTSPMERAAETGSQLANHAPQTSALVSRTPLLQRFPSSYAEAKAEVYKQIIYAARKANQASIALLRKAASYLPESVRPFADAIITIDDVVIGALIAVCLAVIGIVVGFGEGIVDLVKGLVSMIYGAGKLLFDVIMDIFTGGDRTQKDLHAVWEALKGLPDAITKLVKDWLDRFEKASSEQQSLMIGELTGQVLALIATWGVAAGRAGTAAKVVSEGSELAGAGGEATRAAAAATDTATTAAKATKPVLTVIQGGGGSAARAAGTGARAASTGARVAAGADRVGSAALKLAPEVAPEVEQAPRFVPRIVPPPPVAAPAEVATEVATKVAATAAPSTGRAVAAAAGVTAAKTASLPTEEKKKRRRPPFVLKLPATKTLHLELYRKQLGVLQSDPDYDRNFPTRPEQRNKWRQAVRPGGSHAIFPDQWARGARLNIAESERLIPNWTRRDVPMEMEVDHDVELQVVPRRLWETYNSMDHYELLDSSSNASAGSTLDQNIARERATQEAFDPSLVGKILRFDSVEVDGGSSGERWTLHEIVTGAHFDALEGKL